VSGALNMKHEIEKQVAAELENRSKIRSQALSNHEVYTQRLQEHFPPDPPLSEELFYRNSFTGDDEMDYLKGRAVFDGKKWNEVDFDGLYCEYVQFVPLSAIGMIYYLPAFLSYFYDMKHPNSEFKQVLVSSICDGFRTPAIDELEAWSKTGNKPHTDYTEFEVFNPMQSKLIAVYLVAEANLSADSVHSRSAQLALTSYWGNFLLF
jgi:hypothetical protein